MSIYLKVILLLVAVFMMRPSGLGQSLTTVSLVLVLSAFAIHILESLKSKKSFSLTRKNSIVLFTVLVLWTYLLAHALFVNSSQLDFVLKAGLAHIVILTCAALILSHERTNYIFFRWLINILLLFSISYCFTFVLSMFLGIKFDELFLFTLPVEGYESSGNVYFPFTQLYGFMTIGDLKLPRALGLFREAGIFQAFLVWAFFNLKQYGLSSIKTKIILLLGIAGTFSTAGIAVFFIVYATKLFMNKRKLLSVFLVAIGFYSLLYAPYFGIKSKMVTHSTSISDRSSATTNGLNKLLENPIGTGLYNLETGDIANSNINLLASSYTIGLIGVILVLLVYFAPMYKYNFKRKFFIGIFPFLITLLVSQPILDAPFIYIMLLAIYNEKEISSQKHVLKINPFKKLKFKRYKLTW